MPSHGFEGEVDLNNRRRIGFEALLPDLETELRWEPSEGVKGSKSKGFLGRHYYI